MYVILVECNECPFMSSDHSQCHQLTIASVQSCQLTIMIIQLYKLTSQCPVISINLWKFPVLSNDCSGYLIK